MALLKAGTGIGTTSPQVPDGLHVEGGVKVTGISTFNDRVEVGDYLTIVDANAILRRGSGDSLDINVCGTNDFNVTTNFCGGYDGNINLLAKTGGKLFVNGDGGVGLYHTEGAVKLETIGTGVTVTGDLHVSGDITVAGSKTSVGSTSFTGSAGTPHVVDEFTFTDLDAAEYTLKVGFGTYTQVQKVLLMTYDATTTAYTEEYGIMYQPSAIVSIGASVSAGNCQLLVTPVTGVSGVITCKFQREGIS